MKKLITIFVSCSLALAASAMAQQDEATATPGKKKEHEKASAREAQAPQAERPADRPRAGMKSKEQRAERRKTRADAPAKEPAAATDKAKAETTATEPANASTDVKAGQRKKGRNASKAPATTTESASPAPAEVKAQTQTQAPATSQPAKAQAGNTNRSGKAKKPADVQQIKAKHANFRAQPKPQQVPAVTFSQNHQIAGSEQWQGEQYTVFRSYRPAQHDQGWYRSRYTRIELIGGGYYYFNAGYWYPAWGYQPSAQYYVYDGPIYAGRQAEPPDRVIANVQASLQEMGYYKGEVDGLLGPLTREALTGYQSDNGLYTTATIDEPTLDSLGLG